MEIGKKIKDLRIAKGLDPGRAGRPFRTVQGIYFQLERDLTSPFHRYSDRYPAGPGQQP